MSYSTLSIDTVDNRVTLYRDPQGENATLNSSYLYKQLIDLEEGYLQQIAPVHNFNPIEGMITIDLEERDGIYFLHTDLYAYFVEFRLQRVN
jgi:hypothetical protein